VSSDVLILLASSLPYFLSHILLLLTLIGIGISGVVGAGIFVSSGALISTIGSVGGPLSYIIAGGIVACVMYTLSEMVACRPLTGAIIDFPHTFVEPALGFAVGASYSYE
jgi:amino acid transporter